MPKGVLFKKLFHEVGHAEQHDDIVLTLAKVSGQVDELAAMIPEGWRGYTVGPVAGRVDQISEIDARQP